MNKLLTSFILFSIITLGGQAQKKENYYVKHVEFPLNATLEQKNRYGCTFGSNASTSSLATNGTDGFPSFQYKRLYRT